MAEKLTASSSQRFGLISLLFARSIGFLGKRLNDLIFGERRGKRGRERENRKERCDRFWGSPYGGEGRGVGYSRSIIYSQGKTAILTDLHDLIKINFLHQSFIGIYAKLM